MCMHTKIAMNIIHLGVQSFEEWDQWIRFARVYCIVCFSISCFVSVDTGVEQLSICNTVKRRFLISLKQCSTCHPSPHFFNRVCGLFSLETKLFLWSANNVIMVNDHLLT